jgi:site-specific DNA-methyltransferase (adenine-specific)
MTQYLEFLGSVFAECYRVLDPTGMFFLNIGDSARDQGKSESVVRQAEKAGFTRLHTVIWVKSIFGKGHYTPSGGRRRLNHVWEYVFLLVKSSKYRFDGLQIGVPYSDKTNIGRYGKHDLRDPGDVWFIPYTQTTGGSRKKGHEAPFPVGLPYQCIRLVPRTSLVLDPFAGTGSTLIAAETLGIAGIGYELHPDPKVIQQRFLSHSPNIPLPLLPQMETYIEVISEFLEKLRTQIDPSIFRTYSKSLSQNLKQRFAWACDDLDIENPMK